MDMREYHQAKDTLIALMQANPSLLQSAPQTAKSGQAVADFAWAFIDAYVARLKQVEPIR